MKRTMWMVIWALLLGSVVNGQTVKTFVGPPGSTRLQLNGINDSGKLSGYWVNDNTNVVQSVIVDFATGAMTNVPLPTFGSPGAMLIQKITNLNRVVGAEGLYRSATDKRLKQLSGVVGTPPTLRLFNIILNSVTFLNTWGTGVNDSGQTVGYYFDPNVGAMRGVYYHTASTADLVYSVESGIVYPGSAGTESTKLLDINASKDILGSYTTGAPTFTVTHGFVRHAGQYVQFDYPGAITTFPEGMNDAGAIVGSFFFSTDPQAPDHTRHGFTYINGAFTQVDLGGVDIILTDINTAGQIVGYRETDSFVITP